MLPDEMTRMNGGSLASSWSWTRHFFSSDKSTFVPNFIVLNECEEEEEEEDDGDFLLACEFYFKILKSLN